MNTTTPDLARFLVRIPQDLATALRARAKAEDRSMRAVLERALRAYLRDTRTLPVGDADTAR